MTGIINEDEYKLESLVNKCRCCFSELENDQNITEINAKIKQNFYILTNLELIEDDELSKLICNTCNNDIEVFIKFRSTFIEKQKKLYNRHAKLRKDLNESFTETQQIKTEDETSNIFIDCTPFVTVQRLDDCMDFFNVEQNNSEMSQNDDKILKLEDEDSESDEHMKLLKEFRDVLQGTKDRQVQCPRCFKYLHRDSIKEHVNVVHFKMNKFSCEQPFCDYTASRYGRIMHHMKAIHGAEVDSRYDSNKPKKQCRICGSFVRNWRRHAMKVHLNIKNYFCDVCGFGSFFKSDMEVHVRTHISKEKKEIQKFYCEICGLDFDKRFHLNSHVKAKHTVKERSHHCSVCTKSFFSAENLKKHIESHSEKDMPCEYCGKLFSCMNNLRTHLYYHSEPKFICDFPNCDKKFFMRKRLRAHLKTHNGIKDFQCNFCDKSYFSQNDLNRHMFSIHEKLRFLCEVPGCQGNFSRREYYKKHAIAHHQQLGQERLDILLKKIREAVPVQKV